jgi:hypothetical protein
MMGERGLWVVKTMDHICRSGQESQNSVRFIPGIGWKLLSYEDALGGKHETTAGQTGILTVASGNLTVPSKFTESNRQRWNSDLTGVSQGGSSSTGDPHIQKNVTAGDNWGANLTYRLGADQTSFDQPDTVGDTIAMDRVAVSSTNHAPWERISLGFSYSQPSVATYGDIDTLYFCGPAGNDALGVGTGQYALKQRGDGVAALFERLVTGSWVKRDQFQYRVPMKGSICAFSLSVYSDAYLGSDSRWHGTKIVFETDWSQGVVSTLAAVAESSLKPRDTWQKVYHVPITKGQQPSTTLAPIRLDIRRDVRASFQLRKARYLPTGTLRGDTVVLPYNSQGGSSVEPISLTWFGQLPTGTSVTVLLYDGETDAALTPSGAQVDFEDGGYRYFEPVQNGRYVYPIFTFSSDVDGAFSPTLIRQHIIRGDKAKDLAPSTTTLPNVESVSITGATSDPSHSTARIECVDLKGELDDILRIRSKMPIKVDTQYDPNDAAKRMVLFQGYVARARRKRHGTTRKLGFANTSSPKVASAYPSSDWGRYSIRAMGEWQRLEKMQMPRSWDFNFDPESPRINGALQPYKVTDAIRALFIFAGYDPVQIDIPDMPLRLLAQPGQQLYLEAYTPIGPVIVAWARDLLGGWIVFDSNADNTSPPAASTCRGCWRLKIPPRQQLTGQDYNFLANFLEKPDPTVTGRVPSTDPAAYPDYAGSSPFTSQTIKQTFIRHGCYDDDVVPPECNIVYVTGVGSFSGGSAAVGGPIKSAGAAGIETYQLQQCAVNWKSAYFREDQGNANCPPAPDPTHPDYLGDIWPYYYSDPGLCTQAAVNFAARRIYDIACHAQKWAWFEAPLIGVTDSEDTLQVNPRPLQFGDMVLVKGQPFVVNDVSIDYSGVKGGDRFQHAIYEVFSPPYLQDYTQLGDNYTLSNGRPVMW